MPWYYVFTYLHMYSKVVKNMQYILGTPAETTLGFLFDSDSEEIIAILYRIKMHPDSGQSKVNLGMASLWKVGGMI